MTAVGISGLLAFFTALPSIPAWIAGVGLALSLPMPGTGIIAALLQALP
ncbi:hypothetical protein [Frigidibacter sp. ROC022]|nr:hypothetical protein [Frigidibacter sp. ROC022]MCR8726275.1 hypothetical protein [Frigidibacter sp. ROC022]